ncbi:MAG: phosphate ABC transporter permease subunit PstC [Akkermansia sp.]|nr:phosphate ABC transporter permease subunit PstC [Akkermansia sp.]
MKHIDIVFRYLCMACAAVAGCLLLGILVQLIQNSADAWSEFGIEFIWSEEWDAYENKFGALPHIAGTLLTTALALILSVPLAFASALLLTESPKWIERILSPCVDLLAAIPSVIYGMWGLFVLVPIMQDDVQPFLAEELGLIHLPGGEWLLGDDGVGCGFGFLTAGIILAVMILPYMSAVMRDVLRMTPSMLKESAYGIGCTRREVITDVVLRHGAPGILGGICIGMGRALGETMAVLFVIGNLPQMPEGLYSFGTTISATLANNFGEAVDMERSALFALGLILLVLCFIIQLIAHQLLRRNKLKLATQR